MRKHLFSMRTRILTVFLGVIFAIFISITIAFNVLINTYIGQTATNQLSAVEIVQFFPGSGQGIVLPDLSGTPLSALNTRPLVFRMDSSYNVYTPDNWSVENQQTAQNIADEIKIRYNAFERNSVQISTGDNTYYVRNVKLDNGDFIVFYVDVTGLVNLADRVNFFLIFIMIAAVAATFLAVFLITLRMTRPIARLTEFSKRIGTGDFTPCSENFHDHEIATLADSMNYAANQLDSYDKDQKVFFQNASHELRTPLMSIKCYAEGIVYGIMDAKKASGTILSEADRLSEMVEDLLTVSRIDNITKERKFFPRDLRELMAAAADEQQGVAEKNGLVFTFDFDKSPVTLNVNDKMLLKAFSNLISNALRYAKNEIALTCNHSDGHITVAVADDGNGINPEDLPHIFERFYKGKDGNHGIGLSIVKSVVEQHGGKIGVQSGDDGTTFALVFSSTGSGKESGL